MRLCSFVLVLALLPACSTVPTEAPAGPAPAFADVSAADREAGADRFPVEVRGQWGYIDRHGELAIAPQFDAARPFSEGRAAVQTAAGWGFVDPAGRLAVAPVWDEVSDVAGGRARVAVRTPAGLRYGFVDAEGAEVVPPEAVAAYDFAAGLAPVRFVERDAPLGLPLLAAIGQPGPGPWRLVGPDGATRARLDVESVTAGAADPGLNAAFPVEVSGGFTGARRWGYADRTGRIAIRPRFEAAGRFAEGLAPAAQGGAFGFVGPDGQFVAPPQYDAAFGVSDGRVRVARGGRWGFLAVDEVRAGATPELAWDAALDASEGLAAVQRDGRWGYLGPDGALVLPLRYAFATPFRNGLALVRDAEGLAYIDPTGAVVWRGE